MTVRGTQVSGNLTKDTGPLQLKQFAAYTPGNARKVKRDGSSARRRRQQPRVSDSLPKDSDHNQRDKIYATIDGQFVSWDNNMAASVLQPDVKPATQVVTATIDGQIETWLNNWFGTASTPMVATDLTTLAPHTITASKSTNTPFYSACIATC